MQVEEEVRGDGARSVETPLSQAQTESKASGGLDESSSSSGSSSSSSSTSSSSSSDSSD